mmetsp:Transcript_6643/g.18539  ORF Transcript_6643/g.18539 Transcript_6643/m.18539 type:complete len:383 (+) Transcript_6643:435-1583(+)|eukprot:CAMPEP_0117662182 /NCGR_PEP_ID=MMETSP0804-20121206/7921_1 /TAXON_ID=1074897 /ORGANISM="Tetraselmis astigmatica, Strain CCMP880" /LENGTH=382 /DNA_ID=CAMNT_0005469073 /DNA_START=451 /DNA_END=1599 /DNA_ORIENTATION=-
MGVSDSAATAAEAGRAGGGGGGVAASSPDAAGPPSPSPWVHAASGQLAGMVGLTVIHPIDTVKCRMQAVAPGRRLSGLSTASQLLAKEGLSGMYKGVGAPLCAFGAINAVNFSVHAHALDTMKSLGVGGSVNKDTGAWQSSVAGNAFAGATAGLASSIIRSPAERIKTVQQAQKLGKPIYRGTLHCARELLRQHGLLGGWFLGTGATIAREVPQMAAYFLTYDYVKEKCLQLAGDSYESQATFMAGGCAGVFQWVITYPLDVVKTRIQASPPGTYRGIWDCAVTSVKAEGMEVMSRGLGIACVRAFPLHATIFLTCETARTFLTKLENGGVEFTVPGMSTAATAEGTACQPPASAEEPFPEAHPPVTHSPPVQLTAATSPES